LEYLEAAYEEMTVEQRDAVFGNIDAKAPRSAVDGPSLLGDIEEFKCESLAGSYYRPFNMNSKNFRHVPEETHEWFDQLAEFLLDSAQLTKQGGHESAVACFAILFELIEAMEQGDEIVFAEELPGVLRAASAWPV
jgi:hypothetical protein